MYLVTKKCHNGTDRHSKDFSGAKQEIYSATNRAVRILVFHVCAVLTVVQVSRDDLIWYQFKKMDKTKVHNPWFHMNKWVLICALVGHLRRSFEIWVVLQSNLTRKKSEASQLYHGSMESSFPWYFGNMFLTSKEFELRIFVAYLKKKPKNKKPSRLLHIILKSLF